MAGLVPAIQVFTVLPCRKDVDTREERGHDAALVAHAKQN
jgi:hypothetical protein